MFETGARPSVRLERRRLADGERAQVSYMQRRASEVFWRVVSPSQGYEMRFDVHTRSFAALGGVVRRGIYGNIISLACERV